MVANSCKLWDSDIASIYPKQYVLHWLLAEKLLATCQENELWDCFNCEPRNHEHNRKWFRDRKRVATKKMDVLLSASAKCVKYLNKKLTLRIHCVKFTIALHWMMSIWLRTQRIVHKVGSTSENPASVVAGAAWTGLQHQLKRSCGPGWPRCVQKNHSIHHCIFTTHPWEYASDSQYEPLQQHFWHGNCAVAEWNSYGSSNQTVQVARPCSIESVKRKWWVQWNSENEVSWWETMPFKKTVRERERERDKKTSKETERKSDKEREREKRRAKET